MPQMVVKCFITEAPLASGARLRIVFTANVYPSDARKHHMFIQADSERLAYLISANLAELSRHLGKSRALYLAGLRWRKGQGYMLSAFVGRLMPPAKALNIRL
jgi:hypothetical protein